MINYSKTFIILFLILSAANIKIFCQNQPEADRIQDSTNTSQAISFSIGELFEVGYRKSFSNNWYWRAVVLLAHDYSDEKGSLTWSGKDRVIENAYSFGLKLQTIYSINIYKPVYLNIGGGVLFTRGNDSYKAKDEETQEYYSDDHIRTSVGLSFLTGIEIKVFKQFRITGSFNIFAGYKEESAERIQRKRYNLEIENIMIGGLIYF